MNISSTRSCTANILQDALDEQLQNVFGYQSFKSHQRAIIEHLLSGHSGLVIMPTGAGKSICYQLPTLFQSGTALVISPLIALMKNQIDRLRSLGVSAHYLNSTLTRKEDAIVREEIRSGDVKLLYVAPESLVKEENRDFFKRIQIPFVAIDEAHCISEWGHDFRPEYRRIRDIVDQLGHIPILALTATATPRVQIDIQKNLSIEREKVFKSSFDRANLFYEVVPKKSARRQLVGFVKSRPKESGIVYCLTRKKVEEIAKTLQLNDITSVPYHAGLDTKTREKNQDDFLSKRVPLIVATVAFGMGIDKSDIRFIVHYDAPKSLEGYYQETGRAGRDGEDAHCLMLFSKHDINKVKKLNKDKPLSVRDNHQMLLDEVIAYAKSPVCRRSQLLLYFGEQYSKDQCNRCDNCMRPQSSFDARSHLKLILKTIQQILHHNPISYVIEVLMGRKSDRVQTSEGHRVTTFGKGRFESEELWDSLIIQAVHQGFVCRQLQFDNLLETLSLSEKGEEYLRKPYEVLFRKPHHYEERVSEEIEEGIQRDMLEKKNEKSDPVLLERIIELQRSLAVKHQVPPYVIFQKKSLEKMSSRYPTTVEELTQIQGIGHGKAKKYGAPFLELICSYVSANDIQPQREVTMKSSGIQSRVKINIIAQVDKKIPFEDIAERCSITIDQLIDELEHICYSGTKLNLDYHINALLDKDQQEEIHRYLLENETDDLTHIYDSLSEYTEQEVRLMHIKFVSECGN